VNEVENREDNGVAGSVGSREIDGVGPVGQKSVEAVLEITVRIVVRLGGAGA